MIINKSIENYINLKSTDEDPLLAELNRETHLKVLNSRMLSGHHQGRVLEILSKIIAPTNILEIGTYTGYSGICLARGLKQGGHLHTIERNDELIRFPKEYFRKAGLEDKITIHHGNALTIIPNLNIMFDLVFIDADKQQYLNYYELCIDKTNSGAILLVDNVLWSGKVVSKNAVNDPDTKAIMEFNDYIKNDTRVEIVILPIRDGISIIRKLQKNIIE